MRRRLAGLLSQRRFHVGLAAVGSGCSTIACYYYLRHRLYDSHCNTAATATDAEQQQQQHLPPSQALEASMVGQVSQAHIRKPLVFQWSSIPRFIERRFDHNAESLENGFLWNFGSTLVVGGVGMLAKVVLKYLETTRVYNLDNFTTIVNEADRERGLITVSNHESVWDDPIIWGVLPSKTLFDIHRMRWVLGAADICYTSLFRSIFFSLGQTIPTIRGVGIYQPGVDFAIRKANDGDWIHIFPEARVNQSDSMIRFKWGVGRIVMESKKCPVVIPVWHNGMAQVRPLNGPPVRFFQPVTIAFGEPIDFQDTLDAWHAGDISETEARIKITSTIFDALAALKAKTEQMKEDLELGTECEGTTKP